MRIFVFVILATMLLSSAVFSGPPVAFRHEDYSSAATLMMPGWGMRSGRSNDTDVAQLAGDLQQIKMAKTRIQQAVAKPLAVERQRELLGLSGGSVNISKLFEMAVEWWWASVFEPAYRISNNPAASCYEASLAIRELQSIERQRELIGIGGEPEETDQSEAARRIRAENARFAEARSKIMKSLEKRCKEESLDECNLTGNFSAVIQDALSFEMQAQLLGSGESLNLNWSEDVLRECAIFELHFNSKASTGPRPKISTEVDGRIKMEYVGGSIDDLDVSGKTAPGGVNPFLVSIECDGTGIIACGPGATPTGPFTAKFTAFTMKRTFFDIDANYTPFTRTDGKDTMAVEFAGSVLVTNMVVEFAKSRMTTLVEAGWTAFRIAHKKDRRNEVYFDIKGPKDDVYPPHVKRGVYPVLYEITYKDRDSEGRLQAEDLTKFEIIHKPDRKPFPPRTDEPLRRQPLKKPARRTQ